uniref:Uncharacterized protein n=1 Tax=Cacopsylla melanoneura TaxID=428564 RepID=A0A8D8T2P5_9HEMI
MPTFLRVVGFFICRPFLSPIAFLLLLLILLLLQHSPHSLLILSLTMSASSLTILPSPSYRYSFPPSLFCSPYPPTFIVSQLFVSSVPPLLLSSVSYLPLLILTFSYDYFSSFSLNSLSPLSSISPLLFFLLL